MFIKLPRCGQSALTSSHDPEEGPGPALKGTTVQASLAPGCRRPWVRALGFLMANEVPYWGPQDPQEGTVLPRCRVAPSEQLVVSRGNSGHCR